MSTSQVAGPPPAAAPSLNHRVREAVASIRAQTDHRPKVGLILGSGLGELAEEISDPLVIAYDAIPHHFRPTVAGHAGQLVLGHLEGVPVVALRGRLHFYEGYSLQQVTLPVRVVRRLGAEVLVVTNAAGGLNPAFSAGDLMLISDHVNLMGMAGLSPLIGPEEPGLGERFLSTVDAYDAELRRIARSSAEEAGMGLQEGTYLMVAGPAFETLAELRFLRLTGADAVGMSTIPEVLVARQEGMRVLAISAITNMAGDAAAGLSHSAVLAGAEQIRPRLSRLVQGVVAALR